MTDIFCKSRIWSKEKNQKLAETYMLESARKKLKVANMHDRELTGQRERERGRERERVS